jgi:uncharacterized OsmC-like protein
MVELTTAPEFVNGLNKTAILGAKAKMRAHPSFAKSDAVCIIAHWDKGVVTDVTGKLVCHPPPEIARGEAKYPSMNSFCPLISAGCFCLIFMMEAAEKDMHFESFETSMAIDADYSCFYKQSARGQNPWSQGIDLDVHIVGPQSQEEMDALGENADNHCPSVEILRREFPVEVVLQGTQLEMDDRTVYYDMDKYEKLSQQSEPVIVNQSAKGTWCCQPDQCGVYPGALMKFEFGLEENTIIPISHDQPIASGKYANPVQACFFGGLSTHMHTVAMLLYTKGYVIKSMKGTLKTTMNKRVVMAVDSHKYIFRMGTDILLEIESDAPQDVLDHIQFEAEEMSPAMMNWSNSIPIHLEIVKETEPSTNKLRTLLRPRKTKTAQREWRKGWGLGKLLDRLKRPPKNH